MLCTIERHVSPLECRGLRFPGRPLRNAKGGGHSYLAATDIEHRLEMIDVVRIDALYEYLNSDFVQSNNALLAAGEDFTNFQSGQMAAFTQQGAEVYHQEPRRSTP